MSPVEIRATAGLAAVYGLRMFGMFIILPVFAFYAESLPGENNYTLIGIALGAYGLTQAIFQIPFGWLSDRIGRKPVIYFGLILFALGSFIAASAEDIYWVIFGRIVQGSGAISAAIMALAADLTREEHRTKAMASIGMTIGTVFALSLIIAPALNRLIGVPGIFIMTGILALLAILVVYKIIPNPQLCRFHSDTEAAPGRFINVLSSRVLPDPRAHKTLRIPIQLILGIIPFRHEEPGPLLLPLFPPFVPPYFPCPLPFPSNPFPFPFG